MAQTARKYRLRYQNGQWGLYVFDWHPRPFRSYKTLPGAMQAALSLRKGWWARNGRNP